MDDYISLFNLEVYAINDSTGRTISSRARSDRIDHKDMLNIIQILSETLASMIRQNNAILIKNKIIKLDESFKSEIDTQ